jgi:hypothetical protein
MPQNSEVFERRVLEAGMYEINKRDQNRLHV